MSTSLTEPSKSRCLLRSYMYVVGYTTSLMPQYSVVPFEFREIVVRVKVSAHEG